jgi:hypothetical protein
VQGNSAPGNSQPASIRSMQNQIRIKVSYAFNQMKRQKKQNRRHLLKMRSE